MSSGFMCMVCGHHFDSHETIGSDTAQTCTECPTGAGRHAPTEDAPDPVTLAELMREEAVLKALAERVKGRLSYVKGIVQDEIDRVTEATGVRPGTTTVKLPDGTDLASVYGSGAGDPEAQVDDMDILVQWAIRNAPTEIERQFVTTVRPAYLTKILGEMTAAGTPRIADPTTGEIHDVPGISVRPRRARTHSVRLKAGAQGAIDRAWQDGSLNLPGITRPEITSA